MMIKLSRDKLVRLAAELRAEAEADTRKASRMVAELEIRTAELEAEAEQLRRDKAAQIEQLLEAIR